MRNKVLSILVAVGVICGLNIPASALPTEAQYNNPALLQQVTEIVDEQFSDVDPSSPEYAQLIAATYEKYDIPQAISTFSASSSASDEEVDEEVEAAYGAFLEKMTYVVDTIDSLGEETYKDNTEFNRDFLVENYDEVSEIDGINLDVIDWYIDEASAALATQDLPASATKPSTRAYSSSAAVNYANTYWSSYNSAYPNWNAYGGDCANFVSQCVHAGGKPYNISESAATSTTASNWANWYSYGSATNTTKVSSTHRGANAFKSYWQSKVSYNTFTAVNSTSFAYGYTGDAISLLDSSGLAYHTLLIIGYPGSNDFTVAAHTDNTKTKKLSQYGVSNGYIIFRMT